MGIDGLDHVVDPDPRPGTTLEPDGPHDPVPPPDTTPPGGDPSHAPHEREHELEQEDGPKYDGGDIPR